LTLTAIKAAHSVIWAFIVACIVAIWVFAGRGNMALAAIAIGGVSIEVLVLAFNRWHCPLTPGRPLRRRPSRQFRYLSDLLAGEADQVDLWRPLCGRHRVRPCPMGLVGAVIESLPNG
jgi:hypothetical protein